ncbi:MAG: VWA domain-containing protein, partial [Planctomycetes bacterium]|nr:VWA domain-containing protein [Planctomycetota bacterium]
MKPLKGLKTWWQKQTGEEETPFDGDAPVWVISLLFNLALIFVLAFVTLKNNKDSNFVDVIAQIEDEEMEELTLPEDYAPSEFANDDIGAQSLNADAMALAAAPTLADIPVIPSEVEIETQDITIRRVDPTYAAAAAHQYDNLPVKGHVGVGTTGASGAIDILTKEILNSLETGPKKTLVVWLFDQSGSLSRQRKEINDRFNRIYKELGLIEASGNDAFSKHQPLLTSVIAFGKNVTLKIKKPTDNLAEIKQAVADIEMDETGEEKVFSALYMAVNHFKNLRQPGKNERNVMLIAFTDEKGDDAFDVRLAKQPLDVTIDHCKRYQMPVYVVGVPAPFGREKTLVKWIDPDPEYDQSPQWGEVTQGPESFLPERIKLHFASSNEDKDPIDSGFGPFALTRICYETGGIYFAVHPNRNVNKAVSRRETAAFSAHIEHFFDPNVMRKYRPDYVSHGEYMKRVNANGARTALMKAAQLSTVTRM